MAGALAEANKGKKSGMRGELAQLYGYYPHMQPKRPNVAPRDSSQHAGVLAEALLGVAPGSGEALSARDAWDASGRGAEALQAGNYRQAAGEYGNMALGVLGAIPGAGIIARGTQRGAAWMDRNLPTGVNKLLDSIVPQSRSNAITAPAEAASASTFSLQPSGGGTWDGMDMRLFYIHAPGSPQPGFINGAIDPKDPTNFIVTAIAMPGSSNSVGHSGMMNIFRQLKTMHPELQSISGTRNTGARQKAGVVPGEPTSKMRMRLPDVGTR